MQSAEANLKSAQAKLSLLKQGPTAAEMASLRAQVTRARNDLDNAKRNLETAKQNADSAYLDNQVRIAAQELAQAQSNYDNISKIGDKMQVAMAKTQLDQANKNYTSAVAAKSDEIQAQTQLIQAQNAVHSAQASYDSVLAQLADSQQPPSSAEFEQTQAAVEQAQTSLATAQMNYDQATLTAPFDGIITAVNVRPGEQAGGSSAALTIQSAENGMQLKLPIDEADIALIKVGQKATATVDALPGRTFDASVEQIAPTGTTQNNVTTFAVTLAIAGDTSALKVGQSMTANILIEQRTGVLTVPSEAVHGLKNKKSVLVYKSDKEPPVSTEVQTGLDDGIVTEITSGLTEGQQIVLGTKSTGSPNNQNRSANPFGAQMGGSSSGGLGGALGGGKTSGGR